MKYKISFTSFVYLVIVDFCDCFLHPDTGLNSIQLIQKYDFPLERHYVTTSDGYILELHRIPHGRKPTDSKELKPPVLILHGLMGSSADFVNYGENSIAFILADLGYDIWLPNCRGNYWSRNHTALNPDTSKKYWMFSWHEIGIYDIPASIDHILQITRQEKLFYNCHSQGCTSFLVMASLLPKYNAKIRLATALAPGSYISHIGNIWLKFASNYVEQIAAVADFFGIYEFLPHSPINELISKHICTEETNLLEFCASFMASACGYDPEQQNSTLVTVITTNFPAGTSTRQHLHYIQGMKYGHFRQYDFGRATNLHRYGQEFPPDYNLSQITAPVAIYYGANDLLAPAKDVERLAGELANNVRLHLVDFPKFNHIDFIWAIDVQQLVYKPVIELMTQY